MDQVDRIELASIAYQAIALPLSYTWMVRVERIELSYIVWKTRILPLNYTSIYGTHSRNRTYGLLLVRQMLFAAELCG